MWKKYVRSIKNSRRIFQEFLEERYFVTKKYLFLFYQAEKENRVSCRAGLPPESKKPIVLHYKFNADHMNLVNSVQFQFALKSLTKGFDPFLNYKYLT